MGDITDAVDGAAVVYADTFMSYTIPKEKEASRIKALMPFQVTSAALEHARATSGEHPIFMNCLPALCGVEQTAEVVDGPCSVVFDQAENRLHAQKALILYLVHGADFLTG